MTTYLEKDGETGFITNDAELPVMLKRGYKVREPTEAELRIEEAQQHPIRANAEAFVRSAIPVAGTYAAIQAEQALKNISYEEARKNVEARDKYNSTFVGTLAGSALGVGKLMAPVRAAVKGAGLVGTGAVGALEGGLIGTGEEINESILQDRELTAEGVASKALPSMLLGGSLDVGAAAAAKGVSRLTGKTAQFLSSPDAKEKLKKLKGVAENVGIAGALLAGHPVAAGMMFLAKHAGDQLPGAVKKFLPRMRGGPKIFDQGIDKLVDSGVLADVANRLHKNVMSRLDVAPELLGPFRNAITMAAIQGPEATMELHSALSNSPQADDYYARMGIIPTSKEESGAVGGRLAGLAELKRVTKEHSNSLGSAVDGLLSGARAGGLVSGRVDKKGMLAIAENLRAQIRDPEAAFGSITPELSGAAPATTQMAAASALQAAKFLESKIPKDPHSGLPEAMRPPWQPSQLEVDRFNRYKEAVENPAKVLKNMASGYISPEQVETLRAVYPATFRDLQEKLNDRIFAMKSGLSYKQKLAISAIMGPGTAGMTQQQMQLIQAAQAGSMKPADSRAKGPDGRQQVDAEKNLQTQSQRLEGR